MTSWRWRCLLALRGAWLLAIVPLFPLQASAANLDFTLAASEPVVVTGSPRIAIDVGGVTRYATYSSGSGTAALTFAYGVQPGDFDANGITIASPIDLNGGLLTDLAGNPPAALTLAVPDTSGIKVQTYTAAFITNPVTNANANSVSFAISRAPVGASFNYAITSSGGSATVTGSGTFSAATQTVSGVDVSALPFGTLTLSVTVSTVPGGTGAARTATTMPTFTGVLDGVPAAAAAFSLRRLRSAHTGALLRARRSSDNVQQDIGATVGGNLDTAALATFCGASSCFVQTLHDQSGNGLDAVQANATLQPRIFSGGITDAEGGRPALLFASAAPVLIAPAIPGQTITGTFNAVGRLAETSVNRHIIGDRGGGGRIIRAVAGGTGFLVANIGASAASLPGSPLQQRIVTMLSGISGVSGVLDGAVSAGGTGTVFNGDSYPFWIGGGGFGQSAVGDWIGTISEAMVFNTTLSPAERQALERNQGAYYGIAVP